MLPYDAKERVICNSSVSLFARDVEIREGGRARAGLSFLTCPAERNTPPYTFALFYDSPDSPAPDPITPTRRAWRGEPPPAAHSGAWGKRRKPSLRLSKLEDDHETKPRARGRDWSRHGRGGSPGPIPTRPRRRVAQPGGSQTLSSSTDGAGGQRLFACRFPEPRGQTLQKSRRQAGGQALEVVNAAAEPRKAPSQGGMTSLPIPRRRVRPIRPWRGEV